MEYGIKIGNNKHPYFSFHELFEPLFSELVNHNWVTEGLRVNVPDHWYDISEFDSEKMKWISGPMYDFEEDLPAVPGNYVDYHYSYNDFLLKYSEIIGGDWSSIYALSKNDDPIEWFEEYTVHTNIRNFKKETVKHCFLCIDGLYWEFYTHSKRLIDVLKGHIERNDNLSWEKREYKVSQGPRKK